jgi:hypothetical protein
MNNIIINQTDGMRPPPIPPTNNTGDNETLTVTAYWDTPNGVLLQPHIHLKLKHSVVSTLMVKTAYHWDFGDGQESTSPGGSTHL